MPPNDVLHIDARGMKCPWPVLRAARAMRSVRSVTINADDPIAPGELKALADQHGWRFTANGNHLFALDRQG